MATIPTFEAILLEVHQSLGLEPYQTKQKNKFADLGMAIASHSTMLEELLDAVFKALDVDEPSRRDAEQAMMEWAQFHKAVELHTWTLNADQRQVLWNLLGCSYVPGLARRIAFWNLPQALDEGMPGGRFWFLPHIDESTGRVQVPVPQVVDWLLDLLGCPMKQAKDGLGGMRAAREGSQESIERNLYLWRSGNIPRVQSINAYFPDDAKLDFKGVLRVKDGLSEADAFESACQFVKRRNLDAAALRAQIPMTQPGRLEAILDESALDEEKREFVRLLRARYEEPTMQTIRQRLLVARMVQDGYRRLLNLLCPGVDDTCPDPHENKLLQLAGIFGRVYNLTIEAWKPGDTEDQENARFEERLAPWDREEIFLSILPSRRKTASADLGKLLTRRFAALSEGAPLEDLVGLDASSAGPIVARRCQRLKNEIEEDRRIGYLLDRVRSSSPWRALQAESSYWVVSQVAQSVAVSPKARHAAVERMKTLAASPSQTIGAMMIELHTLLNCHRQDLPPDAQERVNALLTEARANPDHAQWNAPLLQYEAKHRLAQNDFEGAARLFHRALEACSERNYGMLRGEAARDAFATHVADRRLIPENHEKYYRNMLAGGIFEDLPESLEDTAVWAAEYFWENLYKPYPGVAYRKPLAMEQVKAFIGEAIPLVWAADWGGLANWIKRHGKTFRESRIREVRGDSVLMLWLKLDHVEARRRYFRRTAPSVHQAEMARFEAILGNWHHAIALLVKAWPEQVNIPDFKGQTPLMLAADSGDEALLRTFLAAGADVDAGDYQGRTALHAAVASGSEACVAALLERNPDVGRATPDEQHTSLHTAARVGHPGIVRRLLAHDASLRSRESARGQMPLALAQEIVGDLPTHELLMAHHGRRIGSRGDFEAVVTALSA